MNAVTPPTTGVSPREKQLPTILQLIFSILAVIILFSGAILFAFVGFVRRSDPLYNPVTAMQWAASMAFGAFLVLPSILFAYLRLKNGVHSQPLFGGRRINWVLFSSLLLLTMPAILLLGNSIASNEDLAWIFLPPLHVMALTLPIFWLVSLALRGLSAGSPQRTWGVFDVGLVLGPGIILILELFALLIIGLLFLAYLTTQPELMDELTNLLDRFSMGSPDPDLVLRTLEPYLTQPIFIFTAIGFASVLVPIVEELFKPIGVWFLAGYNLTPSQGFAAGVLSGAGYALFENLVLSSGTADWAVAVTTRAGTAVVHICTTALMGWALVQAWTEKKYLRLIATYLFAVVVHGVWNGVALLGTGGLQFTDIESFYTSMESTYGFVIIVLVAMVIGLFALLLVFNRRLRHADAREEILDDVHSSEPRDQNPLVM